MLKSVTQIIDLFANAPVERFKGVKGSSHYLTMRDGVQIAIDVMLPANLEVDARIPTIMIMARYWRSMSLHLPDPPNKAFIGTREPLPDYLIPRGFAVVVVDARGTGASTGVNAYPWSEDELLDYAEVAKWLVAQTWSNGNIGTVGISYEGSTAQYLAAAGLANVKAVAPMEYEFDVYTDIALPGGIFNAAFIQMWSESNNLLDNNKTSQLFPWLARPFIKGVRPVDSDKESLTILQQALKDHQANTDVYQAISKIIYRDDVFGNTGVTLDDFSVFRCQAAICASQASLFIWGSWLDGTTADTVIRSHNTLTNPQISIIGAWKHEMTAHASPYQKAQAKPSPLHQEQWAAVTQFFQQTLNQDEKISGKTLFYYTLGEEKWKQTDVFPLPNTTNQTWYFQADYGLSPEKPSTNSAEDSYTVDFAASTGRTNRWHTQMAQPVNYTNRAKADRRLLTYTSAPLSEDMEITGYPIISLYIASTEEDGAFFVYLEDVDEKGYVRYITEGQLRAIHRKISTEAAPYWLGVPYHTFKQADSSPLPRSEFVELHFGLQPTSVLVRKGHSLRVAIAGADKDTFAPIPSNSSAKLRVSRSQIMPSSIELPIIKRENS